MVRRGKLSFYEVVKEKRGGTHEEEKRRDAEQARTDDRHDPVHALAGCPSKPEQTDRDE